MGETVDALSYKADVPTRTKDWVGDKKDAVMEKKDEVMSRVTGTASRVSDATPDREAVKERAGRAKDLVERNPLGMAIGGVAVGFIAGLIAPSTRVEEERLGPAAEQVRSKAAEAGQEALDRGKQVAQSAAQSATETVREEGRQQGQEFTSSVQEKARETGSESQGGEQ
jgi:gas vesicle protein